MTATENSNIWRQVKKLGSDFVWLGGMYDKGEGVWRWTDGEAFTFKYWSIVDKQKNSANPKPYLVMSAGTGIWHQVSKFNLLSSVCENIGNHKGFLFLRSFFLFLMFLFSLLFLLMILLLVLFSSFFLFFFLSFFLSFFFSFFLFDLVYSVSFF